MQMSLASEYRIASAYRACESYYTASDITFHIALPEHFRVESFIRKQLLTKLGDVRLFFSPVDIQGPNRALRMVRLFGPFRFLRET